MTETWTSFGTSILKDDVNSKSPSDRKMKKMPGQEHGKSSSKERNQNFIKQERITCAMSRSYESYQSGNLANYPDWVRQAATARVYAVASMARTWRRSGARMVFWSMQAHKPTGIA